MNIYISGISGTGMGPLALMAADAGIKVCGSDKEAGAIMNELKKHNIMVKIGKQDGEFLQTQHNNMGIDWFVYTSALSDDHPELLLAKKLGLKISKRDELISYLVEKLGLKIIAVAGTHGKTTTTAMTIYACLKLGIPVSYLVGTTLPFAASGHYNPDAKYFIYEADEYDRNFLHFYPYLTAITTVTFDHPDIYASERDYQLAFQQFEKQSQNVVYGGDSDSGLNLAGKVRRIDATLAMQIIHKIYDADDEKLVGILNNFPGVGRRFERIAAGVYSDYGHHPEEIVATIEMAKEEARRLNMSGVVAIYEPHQNSRQYSVMSEYKNAFDGVDKLFWLPTFLTRENPSLAILKPKDFIEKLANKEVAEAAKTDNNLAEKLHELRAQNNLVVLMTAGPADLWLRRVFRDTE